MDVRPCRPEDRSRLTAFLEERNADRVARAGEIVDALDQPALLAWSDGELVGAATYIVEGQDAELLTLHAAELFNGVGSTLLTAVRDAARSAGCAQLRVVTTNDNVDALRFYQRRGFRLASLRPGAVDRSRAALKPTIPETGEHGIRLSDELELVSSTSAPPQPGL
jgi:ribosomal protein S18 acetylase RimI-like enzyme